MTVYRVQDQTKHLGKKTHAQKITYLSDQERRALSLIIDFLVYQPKNKRYINVSEIIDKKLYYEKSKAEKRGLGEFYRKGIKEMENAHLKLKGKLLSEDNQENINKFLEEILSSKKANILKKFLGEVSKSATAICYAHPNLWDKILFAVKGDQLRKLELALVS